MKQAAIIFFLLFPVFLKAQSQNGFITKNILANPDAAIDSLEKQDPVTQYEAACNYYILGRCYEYLNHEDTALKYLIKAKKEFEKLGKTALAKDIALDAYMVISSQENYDKYGTTFLDEYYSYAQTAHSALRLAYSYSEFAKNACYLFDTETRNNIQVLDSALVIYKRALYYAGRSGDDLIKAKLYGNIGVLYNTRRNYNAARKNLDVAYKYIIKIEDTYELFANYYNYGNSYFLEGNFKQAIIYWHKAENIKLPYYRDKATRKLHEKLTEAYDMLNDTPNRRKYQKLFNEQDAKIKDSEQNAIIHDANVKYQVEEKDRQISALQNFRQKFYRHRIVFGILLFLVFLLALYSFIRWKKVDYTRKKLETENKTIQEEHTNTVAQLEKVKQLVIDDHIILKNKTKVYLDKLIYVRAEDHYLYMISAAGKNNFVRGKLSQLTEELPPNFVKCHRSYVVNTNYIKSINSKAILLTNDEEIPISRNFKL